MFVRLFDYLFRSQRYQTTIDHNRISEKVFFEPKPLVVPCVDSLLRGSGISGDENGWEVNWAVRACGGERGDNLLFCSQL